MLSVGCSRGSVSFLWLKCFRPSSLMGIQSRLYKNLAPLVIYDFSYEDEISAPPSSPFASPEFDPFENPRHRRMLSTMAHLRMLLGLEDRVDDVALARLARELSMLRAISVKEKGKHPADWEHPVSLMHVSCFERVVAHCHSPTFLPSAQPRLGLLARPEPNRRLQRPRTLEDRQRRLRGNHSCPRPRSTVQHLAGPSRTLGWSLKF